MAPAAFRCADDTKYRERARPERSGRRRLPKYPPSQRQRRARASGARALFPARTDGASHAVRRPAAAHLSKGHSSVARDFGRAHCAVKCGQYEATSVPGVFVAGNIIKDVQLSIVAAAEGTRAFSINRALTREDFERRATGSRRVQHEDLERTTGASSRRAESAYGLPAGLEPSRSPEPSPPSPGSSIVPV